MAGMVAKGFVRAGVAPRLLTLQSILAPTSIAMVQHTYNIAPVIGGSIFSLRSFSSGVGAMTMYRQSVATASSSFSTTTTISSSSSTPKKGIFANLLDEKNVEAPPSFTKRWLIAIPAFATHMCIGSPWGWSVMSGPLTRELGFVSSCAADWSFSETTVPLSITFALQGIAAALGGKWQIKVGARKAMFVAGMCFGGGLMLGGLGVALHSLPLLYLGYGILGGTGVGLAYTPPVQALIQWFPDRKGLASGMTIAGFGSGALVFTPLANKLMQFFSQPPEYLGPCGSVSTIVQDGRMFADLGGKLTEVVTANAYEISKLASAMPEGVYVVGTGSTGVAETLFTMGAGYLAIMLASALAIRRPAAGYTPAGFSPPVPVSAASPTDNANVAAPSAYSHVPLEKVMKTPQFYLLGTTFFCLACGGMGIFSVAKPMMGEVFGGTFPDVVTASFASSYVMMLSTGNLGGRLGWAFFFDKFGPRTTFNIFTLGCIPLYLSVPLSVSWMMNSPSVAALSVFTAATFTAISFMGGTYALLPAYEASLFGAKNVGAVHGRMLMGRHVHSNVHIAFHMA